MGHRRRLVDRAVPEIADWAQLRLAIGTPGILEDGGGPPPDPELLQPAEHRSTTAAVPVFPETKPLDDLAVLYALLATGIGIAVLVLA